MKPHDFSPGFNSAQQKTSHFKLMYGEQRRLPSLLEQEARFRVVVLVPFPMELASAFPPSKQARLTYNDAFAQLGKGKGEIWRMQG